MSTEPQLPSQLPLYSPLGNRGETATLDARVINGYVEKDGNSVYVVKRPGLSVYTTIGGATGRGIYYYNGHVYAIVDNTFYQDGVSKGSVASAGFYTFSSCLGGTPRLFFHNTANFYTYNDATNTLAAVASPPTTVSVLGQAFLDGTTYVMDTSANVYGSDINDPTTWDALNVIVAQSEPDKGVAIAKQLNYVVAIKEWTTESFWDAGNATGSPLQSSQGSLFFYGCRSAGSVEIFEDTIIWATATQSGTSAVLALENLKPRIISTPAVERLLQEADFSVTYTWSARISGHRFYILTLVNSNFSLVYDLTTQSWFIWTDASENYLPFIAATTTSDKQTLVQKTNGDIYKFEQTNYTDGGAVIPFEVYTPNFDAGTAVRKYLPRMAFHADQNGSGTLQVRCSDDDYKTWSNWRTVDLGRKHPTLDNCGSFRKRAWHLRYNAATFLRLRAVDLQLIPGSL